MPDAIQPDDLQPEPPQPEPTPLAPVARQDRIAAMDVLRGLAVLGIFLINMPLYLAPSAAFFNWENNVLWPGTNDRLATLFIYIFAQGKFYTLFSFLFGLGFGVQMLRATERNSPNFLPIFRRRLTILLIIGILHFTLIWWGDVLHVYALLGFVLLLFRERSDKTLLIWAACLTFFPPIAAIGGTTYEHFTNRQLTAEEKQKNEKKRDERRARNQKNLIEEIRVYSSAPLPVILEHRLQKDKEHLPNEIGWSIELFTNFLIGLWVSRRRILQDPQQYRPLLTRLACLALPIAIALSAADLIYGYQNPGQDTPLWRTHLGLIREFIARPAMTYGFVAAILLTGIQSWMSPFAAVGRMALTNYLMHSLVFTTVANSYGLGLYGRIHPAHGLALCFAFYALQVPFSFLWLKHFNFGPAEWLWRSLTYGKPQPWFRDSLSPTQSPAL
jgi:uncharacterized protein